MTHNAKKRKKTRHTCREKNRALGVVRGWGHILAPPGENSSYPLHASSSSLREGRRSADCVGSHGDSGQRQKRSAGCQVRGAHLSITVVLSAVAGGGTTLSASALTPLCYFVGGGCGALLSMPYTASQLDHQKPRA